MLRCRKNLSFSNHFNFASKFLNSNTFLGVVFGLSRMSDNSVVW